MVEHLLFDSFTNIHYCIFPDLINGNLVFLMTVEILTVFNGIKIGRASRLSLPEYHYPCSKALTRATTLSTVNPYSSIILSPGADAPKVSMARTSPSSPA